ncbi:hypothetical protein Pcinc_034609 [Petrolisthes cinctipes]|uniref:Uncharacterized protein n=1 Tax=Petrolisthes cinctipes TaxID=88211 RepID=A0AAE1C1B3_PETCI|nr:hypothetical protein Pcinc_034609 [Petrolisthes cinctipes]
MLTVVLTYLRSSLSLLAAAGYILLKKCLHRLKGVEEAGVRCCCKNRVQGKVVIITGANSGIGYSTALDLAKKGAKVYLACRRSQEGEGAAQKLRTITGNSQVYYLHLDLAQLSSVRSFVAALTKRERKVDALVNNAAIFHHPPGLTVDNLEVTYHTNFLGVYLLTSLLLELLQCAQSPRIVFISSEAHKLVSVADLLDFNPQELSVLDDFSDHVRNYGISKLGLHLFAKHLIQTSKGVEVVIVDPGNVWTDIYRHSWQAWSQFPTRLYCYIFMKGTLEGAQSTIHALNAPSHIHGKYINSLLDAEEEKKYDSVLVKQFITASSVLSGLHSL